MLYCTLAFAPLFVSHLIAALVCPKYPEIGHCFLYAVTRQRIKKPHNLSTDAQTATKDKTFSAQT